MALTHLQNCSNHKYTYLYVWYNYNGDIEFSLTDEGMELCKECATKGYNMRTTLLELIFCCPRMGDFGIQNFHFTNDTDLPSITRTPIETEKGSFDETWYFSDYKEKNFVRDLLDGKTITFKKLK